MNTSYVLYYDHPDTQGSQVVWDGDRSDGVPEHYRSVKECLDDFNEMENTWGASLYAVPPQIREVTWSSDPSDISETGKVWQLQRSSVDSPYSAFGV